MISNGWVAAAQVVSGLAAVLAVCVAAFQIYRSRLASDLIALQTFFAGMTERERALVEAGHDGHLRRHSFVELMNFLELYAAVDNRLLLGRSCRSLIRDKIADSIVVLELSDWRKEIEKATTTSDTFVELAKFSKRHRKLLEWRRAEFRKANEESIDGR